MAFPETVKGRVLVCKVRRNDSYSFEDFGSTEYAGPICKATCNRNNTSAGIRPPLQIGGDIVLSLHSYTTFNIDGETFLSVFEDNPKTDHASANKMMIIGGGNMIKFCLVIGSLFRSLSGTRFDHARTATKRNEKTSSAYLQPVSTPSPGTGGVQSACTYYLRYCF